MPKKFGGVVTLHKANLNLSQLYNAPVMAAMEIVHQLGRGNCRVVDMKALRDLVRKRYNAMLHGDLDKERRARKREKARAENKPVRSEKGEKHLAARRFAEKHAVHYDEAKKILEKFWEENPDEAAKFELPQYVTDEQLEQAERLAVEDSQPDRQEFPVQPQKTQAQIDYELNVAMCEEENRQQEKVRALAQGKKWDD